MTAPPIPVGPRPTMDPAAFMAAAPIAPSGSSPWASRYADQLRRIAIEHATLAPRNVQRHLGPSELGSECDRQVAGKMAGLPTTNHVVDPWPSIVGTAVHAWLADAFTAENVRRGYARWIAEQRVTPHPNHPGTADLFDGAEQAVVDHKVLGPTTHDKIRRHGPGRGYRVQLHLYGRGYQNLGLPVRRVVLAAWPRTESTLDNLYVWEEAHNTPEIDQLIATVFQETEYRRQLAELLAAGRVHFRDIPATPSDDGCYFCPFYRPQAAKDNAGGCPGTVQSS